MLTPLLAKLWVGSRAYHLPKGEAEVVDEAEVADIISGSRQLLRSRCNFCIRASANSPNQCWLSGLRPPDRGLFWTIACMHFR